MPISASTTTVRPWSEHQPHRRRRIQLAAVLFLLYSLNGVVYSQQLSHHHPQNIDPNSIQPMMGSAGFLVNQFQSGGSGGAGPDFEEEFDDAVGPPAAVVDPQPPELELNYELLSCYDPRTGKARKCMPEFVNAAFGQRIQASNTCGQRQPNEYCVQSNLLYSKNPNYYSPNDSYFGGGGVGGGGGGNGGASPAYTDSGRIHSRCYKCDFNTHSTSYLTDYNNPNNLTWWQSETMLESIQYPTMVNLTLNLGKSYEINYVQIKFQSSRPESFAIYKRTSETSPWEPYQYYSASCQETYNLSPNQIVTHQNEAIALCADEFSDIAPLSGASVVFGTLEDRPSAYNFENSPQLKEWVTATDIRITLNRLNTFGDEVFNDPHVLKSYYYAISDIAVGGRCKCNGHANKCVYEQQEDFEDRLVCKCEHNTAGVDCEQCLPFFNDVPWAPATQFDANECKPCSCNGLSKKCHFNQTLYELTGHGGYCDECEGNTAGPSCEECKHGFYRRENEMRCIDCQCHAFGSESLQCDPNGKCRCKPGVVGDKCDRCAPYHYELSVTGCKMCSCNPVGSFDTPPVCDPRDGNCRCKANVEGQNCDRPKPGFFNLATENPNGALPCFCYGHSSICNSSGNFHAHQLRGRFDAATKWQAVDSYGQPVHTELVYDNHVTVNVQSAHDDIWFVAPAEFLGNQLHSYGQELTFDLRLVDQSQHQTTTYVQAVRPSRKDVVLYSSLYNLEVYIPIYGGGGSTTTGSTGARNQLPSHETQKFTFKLDQHSGWMPTLTSHDFQRMLTNLTSIRIRASYVPSSRAVLSSLTLNTARKNTQDRDRNELKQALFVEECRCPVGHVGQHCESCADGYHREPINGGPFSRCVPCNCNNHSVSCDPDSGRCACMHHTSGDNCEKCQEGYYGNPIPHSIADQSSSSSSGSSSESLGHHHHHHNHFQPSAASSLTEYELANMCKKCPCPNDGPCAEIFNYQLNNVEVVCLACPAGTQGNLCELCDDGYHRIGGTILTSRCERCTCNGNIDENAVGNCDSQSIEERCMRCVFNTTGDQCQECLPGFWGNALTSVKCHACDCFAAGTVEDERGEPKQCNLQDGYCECKPNVKNRQCDQCKEGYWNIHSGKGCEECRCNPLGSFNLSCDGFTGQCYCRPGVQGLKCDSCQPLHYGFSEEGCKPCECDAFGTSQQPQQSGMQCDDFGKCTCKPNFAGLKCNKCAENRYNYTSGCLECDQCYNLVQDRANQVRAKISVIQATLRELWKSSVEAASGIQSAESVQLQNKLRELRALIDELHDNFFRKQYLKETYRESINHLQSELKRINEAIKNTDQLFDQFNVIFKQAESLYNQANQSVFHIQTQLNFIGRSNWDRQNKLESIKQARLNHEQNNRLQSLAKQARETADKQKQIAQNVSQDVQTIVTDSQAAVKKLDELLAKYEQLETEDPSLDYKELRAATNVLIDEANEQKLLLAKSSGEIDELVEKIKQVKIPDEKETERESQETKNTVSNLNAKTSSLRREIDELKSKFEQFANVDSINSIGEAQTRLNTAQIKHQDISYLYKTAERTRNETDKANKLAKEVHENATNILRTLEKFDELITSGKAKVASAELLKPQIEQNIQFSNNLLADLNGQFNILNGKLADIKSISAKSQMILTEANKTVEKLEMKVNELKNASSKLEQSTTELKDKFETSLKDKTNDAHERYLQLSTRSDSVLKQAEQVTNETQRLLDNANNAFESLNKINESLKQFSVSSIKREEILRLQRKFEQISSQLDNEYQIDESISNLERSSKDLLSTAKQYQYQVEFLRKQVENLEQINNSLERKCFANTVVKPEL